MPKGRLVFDGDNLYTEKDARIYKLKTSVSSKIDAIPGVVDSLDSTSTTDALSANMGRTLQDQINAVSGIGKFLSTWNCTTGLPSTNPQEDPYTYRVGDYYVVSVVGATNYKPHGGTFTQGVPSTTVETEAVGVNDKYYFDGADWVRIPDTSPQISVDTALSTTSTNAVENRAITNAINTKQNTIADLSDIRSGAAEGATAVQPGDNITGLTNNAGYQTAGDVASAISTAVSQLTPVNNATLTIQKNGTTVNTFTANASSNVTANITVPTTVAELSDANDYATKTYVDDVADNKVSVGTTAPSPATEGMIWYDTTNNELKTYNGSSWEVMTKGHNNLKVIEGWTDIYDWQAADQYTDEILNWVENESGTVAMIDTDNDSSIYYLKQIRKGDSTTKYLIFETLDYNPNVKINKNTVVVFTLKYNSGWYFDNAEFVAAPVKSNTIAYVLNGLTGAANIAKAQEILNDYVNGAYPIIMYDGHVYMFEEKSSTNMIFRSVFAKTNDYNSYSNVTAYRLTIIDSGGVVTEINSLGSFVVTSPYLRTGYDYPAPYTPQYDGSPATKKYVDDNISTVSSDKQDVLVSGTNIKTINNESILGSGNIAISGGGDSLGKFFNVMKANGTQHTITVNSPTTYVMRGKGYVRVPLMSYGYRLTINGVIIFSHSFDSGSYTPIYDYGPFTVSEGDVVEFSVPGTNGRISATIYDWYDGTIPRTGAGIYHNASLGLITISQDGENYITIADKNLGASDVRNIGDTRSEANCGKFYQWGNNYAFPYSGPSSKSSTKVNVSSYGPNNYYSNSTFRTVSDTDTNWMTTVNEDLWGDITNTLVARKGPCATGYHIPSIAELHNLRDAIFGLGLDGDIVASNNYLKMPLGGDISISGSKEYVGSDATLWSSTYDENADSWVRGISGGGMFFTGSGACTAFGCSIRPFKNTSSAPTLEWDVLYQPS